MMPKSERKGNKLKKNCWRIFVSFISFSFLQPLQFPIFIRSSFGFFLGSRGISASPTADALLFGNLAFLSFLSFHSLTPSVLFLILCALLSVLFSVSVSVSIAVSVSVSVFSLCLCLYLSLNPLLYLCLCPFPFHGRKEGWCLFVNVNRRTRT